MCPIIVDPVITYTLSIGAVRKPHLPRVESVYLFLGFTIILNFTITSTLLFYSLPLPLYLRINILRVDVNSPAFKV